MQLEDCKIMTKRTKKKKKRTKTQQLVNSIMFERLLILVSGMEPTKLTIRLNRSG